MGSDSRSNRSGITKPGVCRRTLETGPQQSTAESITHSFCGSKEWESRRFSHDISSSTRRCITDMADTISTRFLLVASFGCCDRATFAMESCCAGPM